MEEKKDAEENIKSKFKDVEGIIIPGGFSSQGLTGKLLAIKHARENNRSVTFLWY